MSDSFLNHIYTGISPLRVAGILLNKATHCQNGDQQYGCGRQDEKPITPPDTVGKAL